MDLSRWRHGTYHKRICAVMRTSGTGAIRWCKRVRSEPVRRFHTLFCTVEDHEFGVTCVGVSWQRRPDHQKLPKLVVPSSDAEQGVAPMVLITEAPKGRLDGDASRNDFGKYAHTDQRPACTQMARLFTMTVAVTALANSWREMSIQDTLNELHQFQRQTHKPPRSEVGEAMDVSEPPSQPVPTHQVSESSGSTGTDTTHARETESQQFWRTRQRTCEIRREPR